MVTIQELLTAAKQGAGIPSNYRLARVLGVSDNSLNRWQHARGFPDDVTAARLAQMGGLDPGAVVAAMHAQRTAEPEERALWERMAARLQAGAATVGAAVLALFITIGPDGGVSLGGDAQARTVHNVGNVLYIVHSWWRRLVRLVRLHGAGFLEPRPA